MTKGPFLVIAPVVCIVVLSTVACGRGPTAPSDTSPTSSFFSFTSSPGEFIGQGQTRRFDAPGVPFQAISLCGNNHVHIAVNDPNEPSTAWRLAFAAPAGESLRQGTYARAAGWPFQPSSLPAISIGGEGRGCGGIAGDFTVRSADFGPDGTVRRFHATFEQRCQGGSARLTGEIAVLAATLLRMPWQCPTS